MSSDKPLTLKQYRARAFLTIEGLAKKAGVNPDTLYRIQSGDRPRVSTMWKIADALGVHPSQIAEFASSVEQAGDEVGE